MRAIPNGYDPNLELGYTAASASARVMTHGVGLNLVSRRKRQYLMRINPIVRTQ